MHGTQSVKLLYIALTRPHLEHGNVGLHPIYNKDIDLPERVQSYPYVPWFEEIKL